MPIICEYCNKSLKNSKTLSSHQENNSMCLLFQRITGLEKDVKMLKSGEIIASQKNQTETMSKYYSLSSSNAKKSKPKYSSTNFFCDMEIPEGHNFISVSKVIFNKEEYETFRNENKGQISIIIVDGFYILPEKKRKDFFGTVGKFSLDKGPEYVNDNIWETSRNLGKNSWGKKEVHLEIIDEKGEELDFEKDVFIELISW